MRVALMAACAAAILCCPAAGSRAQLLAPGDDRPIQIQADSGIEWQQDAKVYVARGNAVASRGPTELHADTLTAHYRDAKAGTAGGSTEIYRIDAVGNVTIKRDGQVLTGDHLVYDVDQAVGVVTGKALKLTTANDTVTARDSFDWYDQKQIAVARGNAIATRNGKTVRADTITGYMAKATPGTAKPAAASTKPGPAKAGAASPLGSGGESKLSRADAQGHVVVTNGPDVGQSDHAVYNAESGVVTLIGNVVITRDKNVIKGQYAVMDLNNNVSRMMPATAGGAGHPQRVQGLFVRRDGTAATPAGGKAP